MSDITLGIEEIKKLLAHRYPLLLIDKIVKLDPMKGCRAIKNITYNEQVLQGHFPNYPLYPGVYQIEAVAQTAGLAIVYSQPAQGFPVLAKIQNARFKHKVFPGSQLIIDVKILNFKHNIATAKGVVMVKEYDKPELVASEVELTLAVQK